MEVDQKIIRQVILFVVVAVFGVLVIAMVGFWASKPAGNPDVGVSDPGNGQACTLEARACPDGSYVSRNPKKNCEFDVCPVTNQPEVLTCCNQPDWYSCSTSQPEEIIKGTEACQQGGCAACQKSQSVTTRGGGTLTPIGAE